MADLHLWIPGVAQKLNDFRNYSHGRIMTRYKEGSPIKDLFYHLVRTFHFYRGLIEKITVIDG